MKKLEKSFVRQLNTVEAYANCVCTCSCTAYCAAVWSAIYDPNSATAYKGNRYNPERGYGK